MSIESVTFISSYYEANVELTVPLSAFPVRSAGMLCRLKFDAGTGRPKGFGFCHYFGQSTGRHYLVMTSPDPSIRHVQPYRPRDSIISGPKS